MAMEQRTRRRPLTRQEQLVLQERKQLRREKMEQSRELAKGPIDLPFCLLVLLLTAIGLVILLSASFPSAYYEANPSKHNPLHYFERQAVFAVLGTTVMFLVSRFNYQRLRGAGKILLYISLFLLVIVLIPGIGQLRNGARRWIGLGALTFQPSEIAKVAIVVYFAGSISRKKEQMQTFRYGIVPYAFILVLTAGLVGKEPHLSGALLILGAGAAMMLVGGINWRWVFAAIGAVGAMAYVVLFIVGYNTSRVTYWLDPWAIRAISSLRALLPSAPGDSGDWALARAGRNSCFCRKSTTILFSPLSARSWASSAPASSCCSSRRWCCGATGSPCTPGTASVRCWWWVSSPSSPCRCF